jgi:hypothetical protein
MDTIKVHVGTRRTLRSGQAVDSLRPVEFNAEKLARKTSYHGDDDTRGITETLYRTADDQLVVYIEDWSRWQGETTTLALYEIEEEDLQTGGRCEALGFEAGYQDALTLDQALDSLHVPPSEAELFGE